MAVRVNREDKNGLFFITFTCTRWLALFELTNSYDLIYKWFAVLLKNKHQIIAFVIMPNHVHVIINFRENEKQIHTWISNGKRFMAYEIVARLKAQNQQSVLQVLSSDVNKTDLKKGKLHQVFHDSFDAKKILTIDFLLQKLNYLHLNPVSKKWNLVKHFTDYEHSSAACYETMNFDKPFLTHYKDVETLSLVSMRTI